MFCRITLPVLVSVTLLSAQVASFVVVPSASTASATALFSSRYPNQQFHQHQQFPEDDFRHLHQPHPFVNRNVAQVCYEMHCNVNEYKDIVATLEAQRGMLAERIEAIDDVLDTVYSCEDDGMKGVGTSTPHDIAYLARSIENVLQNEGLAHDFGRDTGINNHGRGGHYTPVPPPPPSIEHLRQYEQDLYNLNRINNLEVVDLVKKRADELGNNSTDDVYM